MYKLKVNKIVLPSGVVTKEDFEEKHVAILKKMDKENKTDNVGKYLEEVSEEDEADELSTVRAEYEALTGEKAGRKGLAKLKTEIQDHLDAEDGE